MAAKLTVPKVGTPSSFSTVLHTCLIVIHERQLLKATLGRRLRRNRIIRTA